MNDLPQHLAIEPFTTPAATYLKEAAGFWWGRWWWTIIVPLSACSLLAMIDIRWLFVALVVAFLIVPGVMVNLYVYYLLTPEARRMILTKRVELHPDGALTIHYCDETQPLPSEHIPASLIHHWNYGSRHATAFLSTRPVSFLVIPYDDVLQKESQRQDDI